jgi:DNA-binding NarL/FixJ family response regulator
MDAGELNRLTPRETEVLRLIAEGKTNKQIAEALYISDQTVKNHTLTLYAHLGIDPWSGGNPRVQAAVLFVREGGGEAQP